MEKGVYIGASGLSGSPIIQNNKLIGFYGYSGKNSIAIYAETAYKETLKRIKEKSNKNDFSQETIKVIPGSSGVSIMQKGIGCKVEYLENTKTDIKVGDTILSVDGESILSFSDINKIIENHQLSSCDKIKITYVRNGHIYDTYIDKGADLGIFYCNYNIISKGYITMIDPKTYRYAANSNVNNIYSSEPFSGISIETFYECEYYKEIETYSVGDVVGSITNCGNKFVYGYMEPFGYDETKLVEVAQKEEVKNGIAYYAIDVYNEMMETIR